MNWFKGEIAAAVSQSKEKNAIFVVFVTANDSASQPMSEYINSDKVREKLESDDFVAIKIDAPSDAYTQFARIYQMVPVPSLFFIGKAGTPLEIVTADVQSADKLELTINKVLLLSGRRKMDDLGATTTFIEAEQSAVAAAEVELQATDVAKTAAADSAIPKTDTPSTSQQAAELVDNDNDVVCIDSVCFKKPKNSNDNAAKAPTVKPLDTNTNADAAYVKHMQSTQEAIRREKLAKQAERERIRAQIAADRAEMASKHNLSFENAANTASTSSSTSSKVETPSEATKPDSNTARLQFRFPTGDTKTHTFTGFDTLSIVRNHVKTELLTGTGIKDFDLATTYPRRILLPDLDAETLADLSLVPSAVILVLVKGGSSQNAALSDRAGIYNMLVLLLTSIFRPVSTLFEYLKSFAGARNDEEVNVAGARKRHNEDATSSEQTEKRSNRSNYGTAHRSGYANGSSDASTSQGNNEAKGQARFRANAASNVHRLADNRKDSDDENATWNGNSTQQQ